VLWLAGLFPGDVFYYPVILLLLRSANMRTAKDWIHFRLSSSASDFYPFIIYQLHFIIKFPQIICNIFLDSGLSFEFAVTLCILQSIKSYMLFSVAFWKPQKLCSAVYSSFTAVIRCIPNRSFVINPITCVSESKKSLTVSLYKYVWAFAVKHFLCFRLLSRHNVCLFCTTYFSYLYCELDK